MQLGWFGLTVTRAGMIHKIKAYIFTKITQIITQNNTNRLIIIREKAWLFTKYNAIRHPIFREFLRKVTPSIDEVQFLLTKVDEILVWVSDTFVVSNAVLRLSTACFVVRTLAIKSRSRREK